MASFDLDTFLKVKGNGSGLFKSVGMAYGLPSCLLNIGQEILQLLPSSLLNEISGNVLGGKSKAAEVIKESLKKIFYDTGILEFGTEQGLLKYRSLFSFLGFDYDNAQSDENSTGIIDALIYAADVGAQLYKNYNVVKSDIEAIKNCLGSWNEIKKFQSGSSANQKDLLAKAERDALLEKLYGANRRRLDEASAFVTKCNNTLNSINNILAARRANPLLEPQISDSTEFDQFLANTTFDRVTVNDPGLETPEEVFRLSYGPPISTLGQYLLTSDGLYYDSQKGGLDPIFLSISGVVPLGEGWKFNYDPNLGGKGEQISIEYLNRFTGNLFDPKRIDDSVGMEEFYTQDHFLQVLFGQRDKLMYDLSSTLSVLTSQYGSNSSIVKNHQQTIISELANHNSKVDRRKKQIEIAVKAPIIYGKKSSPLFKQGEIPINDFSYLQDYNLEIDLEQQRALTFKHAEVNGVVLPLNPLFVKSSRKAPSIQLGHLHVPKVGQGSIIYTASGSQGGTMLSLTDQVVSDGLFAIYNFLEAETVLPSSLEFPVTNCATPDMYNTAQLVAPSKQSVFFSGLGIPYLEGIVKNKSTATSSASGLGSFIKLPDTKEFRDLTYSPSGFTMECWVHVPNIMDAGVGWLSSTTSSLTKVLLGCENVGVKSGVSALNSLGQLRDLDYLKNDRGDSFVRGILCGFTRDRRLTQFSAIYSDNNALNNPTSSLSFFVAPTQSRDFSSASFINNDSCQNGSSYYKMKVNVSGTALASVSSQFVQVAISVSPGDNQVRMFCDGQLLATSSVSEVFGVEDFGTPNLPTFKKNNSFEYSTSTVDGPTTLKSGPKLNTFYTPWVVGGGYTDGMYKYGNFMGPRSGIVSGLRGFIGSLKFYSRPLDTSEVLQNFDAQKGFFKSILL